MAKKDLVFECQTLEGFNNLLNDGYVFLVAPYFQGYLDSSKIMAVYKKRHDAQKKVNELNAAGVPTGLRARVYSMIDLSLNGPTINFKGNEKDS